MKRNLIICATIATGIVVSLFIFLLAPNILCRNNTDFCNEHDYYEMRVCIVPNTLSNDGLTLRISNNTEHIFTYSHLVGVFFELQTRNRFGNWSVVQRK
ncbi:MAG: hypothetical protein FWC89_13180, partial [Defluviitaleaceae bacterium]|nr:hypothetical protein [Defluviitaleaceae bacterium]